MKDGTATATPPKKRVLKVMLSGIVALIVISFIWHFAWIMTGSNEWELKIDKNGTMVYTLKAPGSVMKKFRGVKNYRYSLNNMISPFVDESDDIQKNCDKWLPGCTEYKILKRLDSKSLSNLQLWKFKIFFPFAPREMLLQGQIYQDTLTKEIVIENIAVPNKIDQNKGYVRLTHLHNMWHYTPQKSGEIQVEFTQDFEMGGFFPSILMNLAGTQAVYKILDQDLPKQFALEKYRTAKLDFIQEPAISEVK